MGSGFKFWSERTRTTNQIQPLLQEKFNEVTGAIIAALVQLPPLPGARGVPIQFVIKTTDPFERLNEVNQEFLAKARASGMFNFSDTDLKIDKAETNVLLNRDKISEFGLTMNDIANVLGGALSQNYINYFNFSGRSYQVIPQTTRAERYNQNQLLNYYIYG